jgi:hypothetical protein
LAILFPAGTGREPMTLSLGGPVREIEQEREHLLQVLNDAVEPLRRIVAG